MLRQNFTELTISPSEHYFQEPTSKLWFRHQIKNSYAFDLKELHNEATYLAHALLRNWMLNPSRVSPLAKGEVLDLMSKGIFKSGIADVFQNEGFDTTRIPADVATQYVFTHQYQLVTLIHSFQGLHIEEARQLLKTIYSVLIPDGIVFIRVPDREVEGSERFLETHYAQSQGALYHLQGFLSLLVEVNESILDSGGFIVEETYEVKPGLRDYILRKVKNTPSLCIGMIAKNEERDLPLCFKSLEGVAQGMVFVDTGSTDKTVEVATAWARSQFIEGSYEVTTYTGASEKDEKGDWKLWDFGRARNEYVRKIEEKNRFTHLLWMDADDELQTPLEVRNLILLKQWDVHGIMIQSGGLRWPHHRLWQLGKGITYSGRCHEYPNWGSKPSTVWHNTTIYHNATPGAGENSNSRNLRILEREFKEQPTPRNAFYLGNTYKDGGNHKEAIPAYKARINFGKGYEDEYWFAYLYLGRCERMAGLHADAEKTLLHAAKEKPEWAEFWMELCYLKMDQGEYWRAIGYALLTKDRPVVPTALFRESTKYTDQPYRMISWSYEHLGLIEEALYWAYLAKEKIPGPDESWEDRITRLETSKKKVLTPGVNEKVLTRKVNKKPVLWHRPGALGDIIMTANLLAPFKRENPGVEVHYACSPGVIPHLSEFLTAAGFDKVIPNSFNHSDYSRVFNLIGYPRAEGYPKRPMKKHLLEYFRDELGIKQQDVFSELRLVPVMPTRNKGSVTLHPKAGWSPYKNWDVSKWEQVVAVLIQKGYRVCLLGAKEDPFIKGCEDFRGISLWGAMNLQGKADFHLGVDSWSNHATNIIWEGNGKTPAIILWGSTQAAAAGYKHNINLSVGLPCQPCFKEDPKISSETNGICEFPPNQTYENPRHQCMADISVEMVLENLQHIQDWLS